MSQTIQEIIKGAGMTQVQAAEKCGMHPATFSIAINRGVWPLRKGQADKDNLRALLKELGVEHSEINRLVPAAEAAPQPAKKIQNEDTFMLMRKQTLLPKTRRAFGIHGEPFGDDLGGPEGIFLSDNYRYVREYMLHIAQHGGLMALIGESGSGKTTLVRDLNDRVRREQLDIIVVEPYVLGLEEDDRIGKSLKATHIAEAIIRAIDPSEKIPPRPEALFRLLHETLRNSVQVGKKVVLVIEEAHGMPDSTLKHLKRFSELRDGFTRLLSIILVGQQELKSKLSETKVKVREVVQRMEIVELAPIDDLQGYITHRLAQCDLAFEKLFSPCALEALSQKLTGPRPDGDDKPVSLLYPLAVGNVLTAALNLAAQVGEREVNSSIINRV